MIGYQDFLIAAAIGIFLFGAKRLPELARSFGQALTEFKKGVSGPSTGTSGASEGGKDEGGSPRPPGALVATPTAARSCASCKALLEPEWKHCPRCGASTPAAAPPAPPPS